jgi:hypothetical protein
MGIKGGKKEPEIDNNKALTKDSQLYAEIIKVMSDPEVSFKEKFQDSVLTVRAKWERERDRERERERAIKKAKR